MREYNLFILKKKYVDSDGEFIYGSLKKLFYLNYNLNYGYCLFEQLCHYINSEVLKSYFFNKFNLLYNDVLVYKGCRIYIKHSRIVIKTKYNLPKVLKVFNIYNKNIFVCDFKNNDFFFLADLSGVFLQTI